MSFCSIQAQPFMGHLSLDGVDDYVISSDSLFNKNGNKTIECFISFCPSTMAVSDAGIFTLKSSKGALNVSVNINSSGSLANIKMKEGNSTNAYNISVFKRNVWNHLALTYQALDSSYSIYFNGDSLGKFISGFNIADSVIIGSGNSFLAANLDDLRFSDSLRYLSSFIPPTIGLSKDSRTIELFHFNDGKGVNVFHGEVGKIFHGKNGAHTNESYFVTPDTIICRGDSLRLMARGGTSFKWTPSKYLSSDSISNPLYSGDSTITYAVKIADTNLCFANKMVSLSIQQLPMPKLGTDTSVCGGKRLALAPGKFVSYLWSNGSVDSSIVVAKGEYWVRVKDTIGCTGSDSIKVDEYPSIDLDLGSDTVVQFGTLLQLDAGPGFSKYLWSTLDNSQKIWANLPLKYSVTVTDSNGCLKSDTIQVSFNTIGVDENFDQSKDIAVFPNPVKRGNYLVINCMDLGLPKELRIYDHIGKLVYLNDLTDAQITLPTIGLKSGLYYVAIRVKDEGLPINQDHRKKFIVINP